MFQIGEPIIHNKKVTLYEAKLNKLDAFCVIKRAASDINLTNRVQMDKDLDKLPETRRKLWPKLALSGTDLHCAILSRIPTECQFLVYTPAVQLVNWEKLSLNLLRKIHERLSEALTALHGLNWQLRACDQADIMAIDPANPETYYFTNFNNIHYKKMPESNKKLKYYDDQTALIFALIKNPLSNEKFTEASEYAFYKYLFKSSVYPDIAKLAKSKTRAVFLNKLKLLFFLKHFDLYLRAKKVPEYIYNKYRTYKYPDSAYYINYIIHQVAN